MKKTGIVVIMGLLLSSLLGLGGCATRCDDRCTIGCGEPCNVDACRKSYVCCPE